MLGLPELTNDISVSGKPWSLDALVGALPLLNGDLNKKAQLVQYLCAKDIINFLRYAKDIYTVFIDFLWYLIESESSVRFRSVDSNFSGR